MSSYTSNRDGGKTNEEGHYRFHVKAWTGNVLSGLQAQAKSPLALGVDITTGDVKVDYSGYGYTAWTDALESVTLTTADPSNPRIDRIVGYIDRGVTPSSAVTNNPGILKFKAVAGTPAGSPSAPNDAAVQTSVGASNPWFSIANVLVGTGVTTISSGNITDTRVLVGATLADSSVTTAKIANSSVTPAKRTGGFKAGALSASLFSSTGSKSITGLTFTPKFIRIYVGFDVPAAGAARECFGITDGTDSFVRGTAVSGSSQARWGVSGTLVNIRTEANASVLVASFTSFNSDGFTFNVTTADSAYSGFYEAYA